MFDAKRFHGVFVIVPTPFHDDLSLDIDGLRDTIRFTIACGAHGVVTPANASEQPYLSDAERLTVLKTTIAEARGKAVVVAGVTASTRLIAAEFARIAAAEGADMVMAMPPNMQRATEPEIRDYYAAIDAAARLPVVVQNWIGPGATPMPARLVADLLRDNEHVRFVKEETEFASDMMTAIRHEAGAALEGVMGGKAGLHLLDEHRRGACGTMPACEVPEVHVALWSALTAGDRARAREIYRLLLPLITFEAGYGTVAYKEVLRRRGIIRSAAVRQTGGKTLDRFAGEDLTEILTDLGPLLTR